MTKQMLSLAIMFLLVINPIRNLPGFFLLKDKNAVEYQRIIPREAFIVLLIILFLLVFSDQVLNLMHISQLSLKISGGVILFLIALKMLFCRPGNHYDGHSIPKSGISDNNRDFTDSCLGCHYLDFTARLLFFKTARGIFSGRPWFTHGVSLGHH